LLLTGAATLVVLVASTVPVEGDAEAKTKSTKKAAPTASVSQKLPPGARKPRSGSCNNDDNRCMGMDETCKGNLCLCKAGYTRCTTNGAEPDPDACRDLQNEFRNCGTCGHECADGQMCERGKCVAFHCGRGETDCGITCANLLEDDQNCGKCGRECPSGFVCKRGSCRL
jgi:hypothetical protein